MNPIDCNASLEPLSHRQLLQKTPWRRLWALMSIERPLLMAVVAYSVVIGALSLAVPVAVQILVNTIALGSLLQPLLVLSILLAGVLGFAGLLQVCQWVTVELLQRRLFIRVSEDIAARLEGVSLQKSKELDAPELVNRFLDVVILQKESARLLLGGLGLALQTFIGLILLAFYHPILLAFDIALVFGFLIVLALGNNAVPTAVAESNEKYRLLSAFQRLAARNDNPALRLETTTLTRSYIAARKRHYVYVLRQMISGVLLQVIGMVTLLGIGGWLVMRGELTLGQLIAAELVVGVVGAGLAKVSKYFESAYDLLASLDKIGKLVDLPLDKGAS